jgi:hypothetical protein
MSDISLTSSLTILIVTALILFVTVFWSIRFLKRSFYPSKIRLLIVMLRSAALLLFLPVLCDLQIGLSRYREQGPHIAFLWDLSRSMNKAGDTDFHPGFVLNTASFRNIKKTARIEHIAGMQDPRPLTEQELRRRETDEPVTDLGRLLRFAEAEARYDYLVLVSDGQSFLGEMPEHITLSRPLRLFTLGVGDSSFSAKPVLHALKTPDFLREGDSAAFSWILENPGTHTLQGAVSLLHGEDTLYRDQISLEAERYREISVKTQGLPSGNRLLYWYFSSGDTREQLSAATLRVFPSTISILCDSELPDPDIAMVRTVLSAGKEYRLYKRDEWREKRPGETPDLLIQTWRGDESSLYAREVPAILFYRGSEDVSMTQELQISSYRSYLLAEKDLHRNAMLWQQLPPVSVYQYRHDATTVLHDADGRTVIAEDRSRRRIVIPAEGLWRWHLAAYEKNWSHVYGHMLRSMVRESLKNSDRQFIAFDRQRYEELQYLPVHAVLHTDDLESLDLPSAQVSLSLLDSNFSELRREHHAPENSIRPDFVISDTGSYHLLARLFVRGREIERDSAAVRVHAYDPETRIQAINVNALRALSANNRGVYAHVNDLDSLLAQIPSDRQRNLISRIFKARFAYPLMILILLLLCAEWILRKRHGGI